ncbi:MAG: hypothetical protein HY606_07840 [Planctomycetes bacterium]|nr:hypothetical protein [Planctomycetota bacterium]
MSDKVWKQAERRVAKMFKSNRTPLSGMNSRHTGSDVIHDKLFIEVKYRKNFPILRWWKETEKRSKTENKWPLLTLVPKNSKVIYAFVPLEESYLKKLMEHFPSNNKPPAELNGK